MKKYRLKRKIEVYGLILFLLGHYYILAVGIIHKFMLLLLNMGFFLEVCILEELFNLELLLIPFQFPILIKTKSSLLLHVFYCSILLK